MPHLCGKTSLYITTVAMVPGGTNFIASNTTQDTSQCIKGPIMYHRMVQEEHKASEPKAGTYAFSIRGVGADADADDIVVSKKLKNDIYGYFG